MSVYFAQQQSGRSRLKAGRNAPQHATTGDMKPQQRSGQCEVTVPTPFTLLCRGLLLHIPLSQMLCADMPHNKPCRKGSQAGRFYHKPMSWNGRPNFFTNPAFLIGAKLARKSWRMCNSTASTTRDTRSSGSQSMLEHGEKCNVASRISRLANCRLHGARLDGIKNRAEVGP